MLTIENASLTDTIGCQVSSSFASPNTTRITNCTDEDDVMGPRYHKRVRIAIIIIMIALSVFGNSVVCWKLVFRRRRRRVSKARVLFLNLAIADLHVACITMTSQVVWEVMGRLWIAGDVFCRFLKFLQTFVLVSSTYMLVSIALDRHIVIVTPLAPSPDPWKLAIATWALSLLPSLPNLYVFRSMEVSPGKCYCTSIFYDRQTPKYHRQVYMGFVFFMVFIAPLVLLVALYAGILLVIWRQGAKSSTTGQQTASSFPRAKVKTLKMTVVVFGAFLVTNVPYMVQEMILAFGNPGILDHNVVALFGVISASNSAINPYIYLFFQRSKRQCGGFCSALLKDAKTWFSCRRLSNLCNSRSPSSPTTMTSLNHNGNYAMTSLNTGTQVEIRSPNKFDV